MLPLQLSTLPLGDVFYPNLSLCHEISMPCWCSKSSHVPLERRPNRANIEWTIDAKSMSEVSTGVWRIIRRKVEHQEEDRTWFDREHLRKTCGTSGHLVPKTGPKSIFFSVPFKIDFLFDVCGSWEEKKISCAPNWPYTMKKETQTSMQNRV